MKGPEGDEVTGNLPYYRKLTLHEIKVLEINVTSINANLNGKQLTNKEN